MRFTLDRMLNNLGFNSNRITHTEDSKNSTRACDYALNCPVFVRMPGGILVEVWDAAQHYGSNQERSEIVLKLKGDRS